MRSSWIVFALVSVLAVSGCAGKPYAFQPVAWGTFVDETVLVSHMNSNQEVDIWRAPTLEQPQWVDDLIPWVNANHEQTQGHLYFVGRSAAFSSANEEQSAVRNADRDAALNIAALMKQKVTSYFKEVQLQETDPDARRAVGAAAEELNRIDIREEFSGEYRDKTYRVKRVRKTADGGVQSTMFVYGLYRIPFGAALVATESAVEKATARLEAQDRNLRERLTGGARAALQKDFEANPTLSNGASK